MLFKLRYRFPVNSAILRWQLTRRNFLDLRENNYLIIVFPGGRGVDVYLGFSSGNGAVYGGFLGGKILYFLFPDDQGQEAGLGSGPSYEPYH